MADTAAPGHRVVQRKTSFFFLPHSRPAAPPTPTSPPSPSLHKPNTPMTTTRTISSSFPGASLVQHALPEAAKFLLLNSTPPQPPYTHSHSHSQSHAHSHTRSHSHSLSCASTTSHGPSFTSPAAPRSSNETCLPPTPLSDSYTLSSSAIPANEGGNSTTKDNNNGTQQSLSTVRTMDQFVVEEELGNGSFGAVFRARHKESGELVAIKKMKKRFTSHGECRSLQEVKALDALRSGPNIVRLHHYFLEKKELHMVFELMDGNMYQLIRNQNGQKLEESRIRSMVFQVLRGLQHMHSKGVMHRDMKPENLLVSGDNVKIADFGLARELKSRPPYTTYVSTRWYRAPEVVLKSSAYSCAVDVWAVGTIAAELTSLRPLFPGKSDVDQLSRMGGVLGSPAPRPLPTDDATTTATDSPNTNPPAYGAGGEWKDGVQLATRMGFTFPTVPVRTLREILPNASEESLELITGLLQYDPKTRLSAYQALHGSWFKDMPEVEELKHLTDVVQQSPDKRRSMFSGLLKKEGKDRKRGFSISITGQNGAEKPSLAVLILKPATPTPHQLSGNSTIPDPTAPQEQHREQSNTPSSSSESQLQPSTNLDTAFDLPIISPISPFWKES